VTLQPRPKSGAAYVGEPFAAFIPLNHSSLMGGTPPFSSPNRSSLLAALNADHTYRGCHRSGRSIRLSLPRFHNLQTGYGSYGRREGGGVHESGAKQATFIGRREMRENSPRRRFLGCGGKKAKKKIASGGLGRRRLGLQGENAPGGTFPGHALSVAGSTTAQQGQRFLGRRVGLGENSRGRLLQNLGAREITGL
jgi:hypothetical protein